MSNTRNRKPFTAESPMPHQGVVFSAVILAIAGFLIFLALRPDGLPIPSAETDSDRRAEVDAATAIGRDDDSSSAGNSTGTAANSLETEIFWDVPADEIDHASLEQYLLDRPIEWYRIIDVNTDLLRTYIRTQDQTPGLQINLVGDHPTTVVVRRAEEHHEGWRAGNASWQGRLADDPASNVSLFVQPDGSLTGVVNSGRTGRIKIESIPGTAHHILWKMLPNVEVEIDQKSCSAITPSPDE